MLQIKDLTYRIAGRTLLDGISLTLPAGHHAGLIGRNGTGKSTLLKLIAGSLQNDGGEIRMPANTRIGMLAQEAPDGPESLLETVLAADKERARLLAEAEIAHDPIELARSTPGSATSRPIAPPLAPPRYWRDSASTRPSRPAPAGISPAGGACG